MSTRQSLPSANILHKKRPLVTRHVFLMQDATILTLARFSSDSDPSEGAEHFVSARPGHQPQHPLWNSQGPTERPLGPSRQWASLQHGLQSTTSAGLTTRHCLKLSLFSLSSAARRLMWKKVNVVPCFFLRYSSFVSFPCCGWTLLLLKLNCWFPQGKDDVTGEPLIQHDDDKPEALMARLRQYKDVAKPVIDLYKSVQMFLFFFCPTAKLQPCCSCIPCNKVVQEICNINPTWLS